MSRRMVPQLEKATAAGVLLAFLGACGGEEPVAPSPPPPPPDPVETSREILIDSVRLVADQRNLDPLDPHDPIRPELVELGRMLAFDRVLSGEKDISCMTCHLPELGGSDALSLTVGQGGQGLGGDRIHPSGVFGPRHSTTLFNLHLRRSLFWDGRLEELEDGELRTDAGAHLTPEMIDVFEFGVTSAQALFPVENRQEMRGGSDNPVGALPDGAFTAVWARLMDRLVEFEDYRALFVAAYPGVAFDDMTFAHASNAIGAFMIEGFAMHDTPFDRFLAGDTTQLSTPALRGALRFMNEHRCMRCHETDSFQDRQGDFHNSGVPQFGPGFSDEPGVGDDLGRERVTGDPADRRLFQVPPLRNVELTAPYGHAGQFATLEAIVRHYNNVEARLREYDVSQIAPELRGTLLNNFDEILANLDTLLIPVRFEEGDAGDIVEFLKSLTDPRALTLDLAPDTVPSGLPVDRLTGGRR